MSRRWFTRLGFLVLFSLMTIMLYSMLDSINIDRDERQVNQEKSMIRKFSFD